MNLYGENSNLYGAIQSDFSTPPKFNLAENQWLEDVFPTKNSPFLGDMLVFREGNLWGNHSIHLPETR